jgi:flagellin-like protein
MMKNNKAVSAVIGVILMVAITVAIAATVFVYVNDLMNKEKNPQVETNTIIEYGKNLNWSAYQSDCMNLVIDWDDEKIVCERDDWCRVPATWQRQCTGPWDDKITWAYFNTQTGATHVEPATDTSDYLQELININIQIRDLLRSNETGT